jgi:asparagine synthase (glutamine-hydrolysing)
MCGIFSVLNGSIFSSEDILDNFSKGVDRGPENSQHKNIGNNCFLGFHRLSINGLNNESNQPIFIDNIYLICNGEIYNYNEIYKKLNIKPQTNSDCEVIIHLYLKYGIENTLHMLDGVFGFLLVDTKLNKIFASRDPLGVRPLYECYSENDRNGVIIFSSEMKSIYGLYKKINDFSDNSYKIEQFIPGTYSEIDFGEKISIKKRNISYYTLPPCSMTISTNDNENVAMLNKLKDLLIDSVKKRVENTDRKIAALLSGGLDSSLIVALITKEIRKQDNCQTSCLRQIDFDDKLETYSIGIEGSEDLKNAKIVASYLNTKHTEILLTEDDFFNAIEEVIYRIESYDVTTVRASIGNYLVGKYIKNNSNAKVIFNGDGSDELFGGYLYTQMCDNEYEFDNESRRLLKNIHSFDVLRSDKCISSNGLEPRTPFLDKSLVNFYMMLPSSVKYYFHKKGGKHIIRQAFEGDFLPNEILWRRKEAFSDGVTSLKKSLFEIIQERIRQDKRFSFPENLENIDLEKEYYLAIYNKYYLNTKETILPYYWMPKYSNTTDPSARTIENY